MHEETPRRQDDALYPWRRADALSESFLYWIAVDSFPIPAVQRGWLLDFIERLSRMLGEKFGLRAESFLQFKALYPHLSETFQKYSTVFYPVPGLTRHPGAKLSETMTVESIQEIVDGKRSFSFNEYVPDYAYWFLEKSGKLQRELFFGYGGFTCLFLTPDPQTNAPPIRIPPGARRSNPVFQKMDVDKLIMMTFSLMDNFQEKSKTLFGEGLQDNPQYAGLPFILPLLCTADFFQQSSEVQAKWFKIFSVYLSESPADRGVVLASAVDLKETLRTLLEAMKNEGLQYFGGG